MRRTRRVTAWVAGADPGHGVLRGLSACASGGLLVVAPLQPTGSPSVDVVVVTVGGAAVTVLAGFVPWWAAAATGIAAVVVSGGLIATTLGLLTVALVVGSMDRDRSAVLRMGAGAAAVHALAWLGRGPRFGSTTALAGIIIVGFMATVLAERPMRRRAVRTTLCCGLAAGMLAVLGLAAASASTRPSFEDASATLRQALDALARGDSAAAADHFDAAGQTFARIDRELSRPWTGPSRVIPLLAQHTNSVAELSRGAARLSNELAVALESLDPALLRASRGEIDVAGLNALNSPLERVERALVDFEQLLVSVRSAWHVAPLQGALAELQVEVTRSRSAASNLGRLTQHLPELLGVDRPQRYFVAFITPSEARGLGGFMGNWAELTADNGVVTLSAFGRTADLTPPEDQQQPLELVEGLTEEFVERYGDFGFAEAPDGRVADEVWLNVTMAPDLPSVAEVIRQLYPRVTGRAIDGVIAIDPSAMASLMEVTGPVTLPGLDQPLESDDAEQYILRDQYHEEEKTDRLDRLEVLARTVIERLLSDELPGPWRLARLMGPVLARDGLTMWSANDATQETFVALGVSGSLPELTGEDALSVVVNNAGANKIDAYLAQDIDYQVTLDAGGRRFVSTAKVTLRNTAPVAGLPTYAGGNPYDKAPGTNLMYLSLYTALPIHSATIDGQPLGLERAVERGWHTGSTFLEVPAGEQRTITIQVIGEVDDGEAYRFRWRPQPAALAPTVAVEVSTFEGKNLLTWTEPDARRDKLLISG